MKIIHKLKKSKILVLLMSLFCIGLSATVFADAAVSVNSQAELVTAINENKHVEIASDFTIDTAIVVPTTYTKSIKGNGHTLTLTDATYIENMFVISGGNVTFDNMILNGNKKGRLVEITGGTLNVLDSRFINGTTDNFTPRNDTAGVNRQRYQGGAIYVESGATVNVTNTHFESNYTKHVAPNANAPEHPSLVPHGGAIYIGGRSTANIKGGQFLNNYSGQTESNGGAEGGAIKVEGGSTLNITSYDVNGQKQRTLFDGNHNYTSASSLGGYQGGAIEVTESIAHITDADFIVKGGFDTGGAIKFQAAGDTNNHNTIENSTFKLVGESLPTVPVTPAYFGTSGGAIVSENSYLTIDKGTFTMEKNPNVTFAGGHIDVVGGGEFNLFNSNLTGNGQGWNQVWRKSAKYGGAIAFENGASAKAHIKDTTISNYTVDSTGGMISVGHRSPVANDEKPYGHTTVDLLMENTNLIGARAYTFDANAAGSGMYVSEGSNVVVRGGRITDMNGNYGSAIYNKGNVTLENKVRISENNNSTQMAAGIYNDGYLNVHSAVFWDNKKTDDSYFNGGNHQFSPGEHSGGTIYAHKDVIIGPDAEFSWLTGKTDIRVIEGQSSIILSGQRAGEPSTNGGKTMYVSISEIENEADQNLFYGKEFAEQAHRHVGYLVARGLTAADLKAPYTPSDMTTSYEPTANDAKNFHYVSNTVPAEKIAGLNDHTGTGLWDYVYNPDNKTVVLGQRAKMVYHSNKAEAALANGEADTDPEGKKLEQVYTFYDSGNGKPKVSIDNQPATDLTVLSVKPTLEGYNFKNWYTVDLKNKPLEATTANDANIYDFKNATFTNTWHGNAPTSEITDILHFESRNTLNTYAAYSKSIVYKVKKTWVGGPNTHDVTVVLSNVTTGAAEEVARKTIPSGSTEYVTFDEVPTIDDQGNTLTYQVTEDAANNNKIQFGKETYAVAINDVTDTVADKEASTVYYEVKNTYEPNKINYTATKVWVGGPSAKGSIKLQLYKDDNAEGPAVTLTDGTTTHTWTDLDESSHAGVAYRYSVKELDENDAAIEHDGTLTLQNNTYTVTYKDNVIMNTYKPTVVTVSGMKTWNDSHNQDGKRPDSITIILNKQVGTNPVEKVTEQVIQADRNREYSFENLPQYENGQKVTYTIDEEEVLGYTKAVDGYNLTNSHTPEVISITGTKTWNDNNNQDGKRPASVTIHLTADGKRVDDKSVVVTAADNWAYTFSDLPKYKAGTAITYAVEEETADNGYTVTYATPVQTDGNIVANVTNTYSPEKVTVSGTKTWRDNDNQDGKRPDSITVILNKQVGTNPVEKVTEQVIQANNNWAYSFDNLPQYENGQKVTYTIDEVSVPGYTKAVDGYNLTNTYSPEKVTVSGTKTWNDSSNQDGKRPASVTIHLTADGKKVADKSVTVTAADNWAYTFSDLPKYKAGTAITYAVEEEAVGNGYVATYATSVQADGNIEANVTNTYSPEKVTVSGTKTWRDNDNQDGKRPSSITVRLLADGAEEAVKTVTANAAGEWVYTFEGLAKFKNGKEVVYTIDEEEVPSYTKKVDGYNLINSHTPEVISVSGTKTWDDNNNQDGKRPDSITVRLLANGVEEASKIVTANAAGEWVYTFEGLAKFKNGQEIVYTIKEDTVALYSTVVSEFNITNTYSPEKVTVAGTKTWHDNHNQDGKRPNSITVQLFANGVKVDSQEVVTNNTDVWAYTFADLPRYENGNEITYTIDEEAVADYTKVISGYNLSNSYTPEVVNIAGEKTWQDNDNQDGKRPSSITVTLHKQVAGVVEKVAEQTVQADSHGKWLYRFANLPKYEAGQEITYTINEVDVPGYTKDVQGYNLVNSYTPEVVQVSGEKTWDDVNDKDGKRPSSITVILNKQVGAGAVEKVSEKVVQADSNGKWLYSFANLPKYEKGQVVVYTIDEVDVPDYTKQINGYNLVNQHVPHRPRVPHVTPPTKPKESKDKVEPKENKVLPKTGETTNLAITLAGFVSILFSIYVKKRHN